MTDLAQRYGAPSRARRTALVAVTVLLAVAGISWLVWVAVSHGRPLVRSQLVSFDYVSQHRVDATFTVVRRDDGVVASCLLRALADDHSIVGERDVSLGAGGATTLTLTRAVRTERAATSVELMGCAAEGQPRRH